MEKLVPRSVWGARPARYVNKGILSAESTCHWNGPKILVRGQTTWDHSKCASLVRGIQNFHMDGRGWSDIAYNFVECPHGYTFEGRGLNVINGANGTHSGNQSSHAICCLAGEGNPFSEAEKLGFRRCIKHIDANTLAPGTCKGHRDHKSTECPGDERYAWVRSGMPVNNDQEDDDMPLSEQDLEAIGRVVKQKLNEGTGRGQTSWASTSKATLSSVQSHTNKLNAILKLVGVNIPEFVEALRPVIVQAIAEGTAGATADEIVDKILERLED